MITHLVSPEATYSMNNIVFFGTEDFSLISLKALVDANFPIVAVVTKPDSPKGRGHVMTPPAVKSFALEHGITVWQPQKLSDINEEIAKLNKPIGVLVSYGKIIPQTTLDLFVPGIINLHPSLLPKYRGPSPIETAILMGEEKTGISIMQLTAEMDAGPIFQQIEIPMSGNVTAEQLYDSLGKKGSDLLLQVLPSIADGSLVPESQNDSLATYSKILKKSDGNIDWNEEAEIIEARIRAYISWPQSHTKLGNIEVIIAKAQAIDANYGNPGNITVNNNELIIDAGLGALRILELKPLGKKEMPISAFLSGYRTQLGV